MNESFSKTKIYFSNYLLNISILISNSNLNIYIDTWFPFFSLNIMLGRIDSKPKQGGGGRHVSPTDSVALSLVL